MGNEKKLNPIARWIWAPKEKKKNYIRANIFIILFMCLSAVLGTLFIFPMILISHTDLQFLLDLFVILLYLIAMTVIGIKIAHVKLFRFEQN
jgi:hypothetical protein